MKGPGPWRIYLDTVELFLRQEKRDSNHCQRISKLSGELWNENKFLLYSRRNIVRTTLHILKYYIEQAWTSGYSLRHRF